MKIDAITMIRNEVDIVNACVAQSEALFNNHSFVDMQSTDGTRETLEQARLAGTISLYNFRTNAKYQSEITETLVREHARSGADWIFLLDADEFLKIDSRSHLEAMLKEFLNDVMHLPWLNMIPSEFGSYDKFSMDQEFRWTGRASSFRKVALTSKFVTENSSFSLSMGNHTVSSLNGGSSSPEVLGIPLLHIPIRSKDRLNYKANREETVLGNKVNGQSDDGMHLKGIKDLSGQVDFSKEHLRGLVKNYGVEFGLNGISDDDFASLPVIKLPPYCIKRTPDIDLDKRVDTSEIQKRDARVQWREHHMPKGSKISAVIEGDEILVKCQAVRGDSTLGVDRFKALDSKIFDSSEKSNFYKIMTEIMSSSFIKPRVYEFSAWSELIPVLSAILSVAKPRRFVELGVHNGMSFFAACNTAQKISLDIECIAIDSWVGDDQAGFHEPEVFNRFKSNLAAHFPKQFYIRGFFDEASEIFEDGSIDLLHIDGFHSYEAVRNDFETWLPKMSNSGVIILHDTNVYRNDFGVWRYWKELSLRYPSFSFNHSHGLGIVYVGSTESPIKEILRWLSEEDDLAQIVQTTFTGLGEMMMEGQRYKFELSQTQHMFKQSISKAESQHLLQTESRSDEVFFAEQHGSLTASATLEAIISDKWWRRTRPLRKLSNKIRKLRGRPLKSWPDLQPR